MHDRHIRGILSIILFGISSSLAAMAPPPATGQSIPYEQEKALWEDHFKRIPDLNVKGSGWKPFNRWVWFTGRRVDPGLGTIAEGARWRAFQEQQEILRQERADGRPTAVWTNLGPINIAGRCTPIAIDPVDHNRMFVGSASGGLWLTTNAGASWEPVDDNLPTLAVGAILFDENDPTTIYVGTGEGNFSGDAVFGVGVLRSTDGGLTWEVYGTGLDWQIGDGKCVNKLEMDPSSGILVAATTSGIFRLENGTWTQTLSGTATGLLRHPTEAGTFYCVLGQTWGGPANGFYRSTDDGLTWTRLTNGWPVSHGRCDISLCRAQPNTIVAGIASTGGALLGIYKSTDGGDTWALAYNTENHYSTQGWYDLVIAIDPTDPNKVYSGGIEIWASTDGGSTFLKRTHWDYAPGHPQYVHADQHGWAFHPDDPNHVYACCDGGVFESTDAGYNWIEITTGMTSMQFYDIDTAQIDLATALGGTQDNGSNLYSGTSTWERVLGGDGFHCSVDYTKPDTIYTEYQFGDHYRSFNRGRTQARIMLGINENGAWDTPFQIDYADTRIAYTAHSKIYKTSNRGTSWTAKTSNLTGLGVTIAQSPSDVNVLYCGYSAARNIHRSTDRGETWTRLTTTGLPTRAITRLKVHPTNPSIVYATYSGFAANNVLKSTDGGITWNPIGGNLPALPVNAIAIDPEDASVIYVGTDLGIWRTEDGGGSWIPYGVGLPNAVIGDLKIMENERILRAGTYGRGLWEAPLTAGSSSVQESPTPARRLAVLDVFPNPLKSGEVAVRFTLAQPGRVRLQIFDPSGRLVETPLDRDLPAGTHRLHWPSRVPSGAYFVRVHQRHEVSTGKLIVQR
jgi:photosystem II stability/assembly factor-like uncharacterized protein